MIKETRAGKWKIEKFAKEERLRKTIEKFNLRDKKGFKYKITLIKKFSEAIYKYPDLEKLPIKLAVIGAEFRNEIVRTYTQEHMTELANARCNLQNTTMGFKPPLEIPKDLPALNFMKECIICIEKKKCISLCQTCWQRIRKALEIKSKEIRPGWEAWGYECNGLLDLSKVEKLLGLRGKKEETQQGLIVEEIGGGGG